jgi:hypothetical protein
MTNQVGQEHGARYAEIARRWFTDGWAGDLAMADDIFSEDLRPNGVHVGVAGPVERIRDRLTGFPDLTTEQCLKPSSSARHRRLLLETRGWTPIHRLWLRLPCTWSGVASWRRAGRR